ncbi:type II secretory pathway component PulJ [Mycobacteroides chelonae]|nr:type II secretory pathway component PulJ [Mycobacteroides chelonae]
MSQHFLVTLLVVVSLAAIGLFGLAMVLAWRDRQTARQHALKQHRRLAALRAYHRTAERRIDQISMAAMQHMLTVAQKGDPQ